MISLGNRVLSLRPTSNQQEGYAKEPEKMYKFVPHCCPITSVKVNKYVRFKNV